MVAAILLVGRLAAFEWPVTGVNPIRLFGQRADGALERGILFEDAGSLRAAGHGELVMVIERNRNMRGFPSALGNAAIVAHDDGLVTCTADSSPSTRSRGGPSSTRSIDRRRWLERVGQERGGELLRHRHREA
jgi:hypothetical protein